MSSHRDPGACSPTAKMMPCWSSCFSQPKGSELPAGRARGVEPQCKSLIESHAVLSGFLREGRTTAIAIKLAKHTKEPISIAGALDP